MVDIVFKTILLFTPIAYCVGVHYYKFEIIFFQIASILIFASAMYDKPKREFNLKNVVTLFIGICLFSVAVNSFQIRCISAMVNIFIGLVDIYILIVYSKDLKKCLNWLVIGLGINTIIYIGQLFGYSPFIDPNTFTGAGAGGRQVVAPEYGGIIGNAPRFAAFIALTLPFVNRIYVIPALIIGFLTKEASIFFSILITLGHDSNLFGAKWIKISIYGIALTLVFLFYKNILASFSIRFMVWKQVIDQIAQRPLFGFGLGNFPIGDYALSSFIQWVYGVGIIGLGFIYICLKRLKWYLLPLVFLCFVEYPFEIPRLYPVIIFTIAYFAIEQKGGECLC